MRIDTNRANLEATTALQTAQAAEASPSRNPGRAERATGGDRVRLSAGVQLASIAASAAEKAPAARPDVVERARALIESGQLGSDAGRLADVLIDRAISQND